MPENKLQIQAEEHNFSSKDAESKKKVTRSKMLARIVAGETMMMKIDEPNTVLEKFSI